MYHDLSAIVDVRTLEVLEKSRAMGGSHSRGWLVRRALVTADVIGLSAAFAAMTVIYGTPSDSSDQVRPLLELLVFGLTLPGWVILGMINGLYDRDEARTEHSTIDEFTAVFNLVTVGSWLLFTTTSLTGVADPVALRMVLFWLLAITFVAAARAAARSLCRRNASYVQNTVIMGAGDVGQLIARKLVQHPEYGIHLVGMLDDAPKDRRGELVDVPLLGPPSSLPNVIRSYDVERVIIAFSNDPHEETLRLIHSMRGHDVQFDLVPRLFELVGPRVDVHTVEGLPLLGLPPARLRRSSRVLKRGLDVVGATIGLIATAPLFAFIAWRVRRDSPGPVFFRQERLGMDMQPFTALKFRTMRVGTDDRVHREYIKATMNAGAEVESSGVYKLDRGDAITRSGRWLRGTSLDELPQLINVLRGEMSLVGPRPCLAYETEHFSPQHFERFLVPAGLTGLWQVTARAQSTFGEALDMDVAYVRGWSLRLDLRLLFRTPVQVIARRASTR
jgi:exopolysaccharide biosynthesis polyprenyl glycosylphosphotransferase